jgi:hypothetical protein
MYDLRLVILQRCRRIKSVNISIVDWISQRIAQNTSKSNYMTESIARDSCFFFVVSCAYKPPKINKRTTSVAQAQIKIAEQTAYRPSPKLIELNHLSIFIFAAVVSSTLLVGISDSQKIK